MLRTDYKLVSRASALALGLALTLAGPANAAERVILANGFDLICNHHEVVDGHVRIYLKASKPDYFELKLEEISGYETVPDPPAEDKTEAVADHATARVTPEARLSADELHPLLKEAGAEHNVDEDLLASVVKAESDGQVRARSRAGAQGLMQLMPGTAKQLGVADSFAPEQNVRGGTAYLDSLLTRYHDNIPLALAAYNAGPEAVDRYHGIPPYRETRLYVARVVHEFNRRLAARRRMASNMATAATATNHPFAGTSAGNSASAETGSE
jgi:Transglycosylase SLT domain